MSTPAVAGELADRALELDPQVALRREPFGALAYHFGTRRLVFLKHPDLVRVVAALGDHASVEAAFDALDVGAAQRLAFARALASMIDSELVRDQAR